MWQPGQLAALRDAQVQGILLDAQAQSVGGDQWIVTRAAAGNGIDTAVTTTTQPLSGLWVLYTTDPRVVRTDAPGVVLQRDWYAVGPLGLNLVAGDRLRSVADASIAFQVSGVVVAQPGYLLGILEVIP